MAIKSTMIIPAVVAMYGENGGNKLEKRIIIKTDSIPEASSATFGKFYCYSGETTSTYTHGYIYECKAEATYDPIIGIYPTKIGFDYTKGNLVEFWQQATPNFEAIDHGIFEYDLSSDIWLISALDKNGNTILPNDWSDLNGFKLYTQDLVDAGFVMLHPMEDYADGEQLQYEIDWHATYNNYYWERIDVQPGVKADDFNTPLSPTNKGASMADLEDVKTSDLTFKGYISTSAPSSSTYNLVTGNMWYNSATLPTTLPIPASSLKVWDGSAWQNSTDSYMPDDLDAWKDLNDGETYVYFAGEWQDYAPQLSPNYFYLNTSTGKWEIKSDVNLPGYPTVSNAPTTDLGIATKAYVDTIAGDFKLGLFDKGTNVNTTANTVVNLVSTLSVYTITPTESTQLTFNTGNLNIPENAMTTFYLIVDMTNGIQTITWPTTVRWGNITPTMTANVKYMFSFMKPYGSNIWIGNLMFTWEEN